MDAEPLSLDRQLCFPLYAASRLMTRIYQPLLEPLGLTYPQYVVLMILWQDAPCSVSHIGERMLLNTNTLTPLLKRLEHLGYVRRSRKSTDERVVEISLTESGAALKERCSGFPDILTETIGLPHERIAELKRQLDAFVQKLRMVDG